MLSTVGDGPSWLRTTDELWNAFGESLDWVTPAEAHNYFDHAGYAAQ
jgi:hypothetical protein